MHSISKTIIMIKKLTFSIIAIITLAVLASCAPLNKDSYLKQFDAFVTKVEQNADKYSHDDWDDADDRFEDFTEDYYERFADKLTNDDKKQLGTLVARYHKVLMMHAINKFSSAATMLEGYAQEMGIREMFQGNENISFESYVEGEDISDLFEPAQ